METKLNPNCSCPKVRCKYHGNCSECRKKHNGKPFCTNTGMKGRIAQLLFGKGKNT